VRREELALLTLGEERIRRAFPCHPERFDRLYEDWNATIPNFQSTRGVLRRHRRPESLH
jgi:predicted AAA+ superfamily ATPase